MCCLCISGYYSDGATQDRTSSPPGASDAKNRSLLRIWLSSYPSAYVSFHTHCSLALACVWHAIGRAEARDDHGWLVSLAYEISTPINQSNPTSGPTLRTRYITSLYFTLSSLTSVGFGNIAPSTNDEKVFAVIVMIVGGR